MLSVSAQTLALKNPKIKSLVGMPDLKTAVAPTAAAQGGVGKPVLTFKQRPRQPGQGLAGPR